ncbi:hypothetical protein LMG24235_08746 [Paraburkholderia sabiae]|nr:hypothetical protein LMG24235_08746 [Paraburkholderia sabiae]
MLLFFADDGRIVGRQRRAAQCRHRLAHEAEEALAEMADRKTLGICAAVGGPETRGIAREMLDGIDDRIGRLFVEEDARRMRFVLVAHGFERPALAVSDHGCAAGLYLHHRNAEVLFRREHECLRAAHVIAQHVERLIAHDLHVGRRLLAHLLHVGTVADHDELALGHLRKRLDDQIDLLVRHHARRRQIEIVLLFAERERLDIDGRKDHFGFALIDLANAA